MCLISWRNFYQLISIGSMYMSSACAVFQNSVVRLDRYFRAWAWTPSTHINIYSMHTPSFCADCRAQMGVRFLAHLYMSRCSSIATSQLLHFCLPPVLLTMHTSGGSVSPEPFCLHVFCSCSWAKQTVLARYIFEWVIIWSITSRAFMYFVPICWSRAFMYFVPIC